MKIKSVSGSVRKLLMIHGVLFDVPWLKGSRQASVLIMVLWILMVISFLAGEYAAGNRSKAAIAVNSVERIQRKAAAWSILTLVSSGQFQNVRNRAHEANQERGADDETGGAKMVWTRLSPGGLPVFVKVEKESSKIGLTSGNEKKTLDGLTALYGDGYEDLAAGLADAIFDWIDQDDLVRLNGAEKKYYHELSSPYEPGNAPFKSMSELFLVKGMNFFFFWGEPQNTLDETESASVSRSGTLGLFKNGKDGTKDKTSDGDSGDESSDSSVSSFLETFTVYPKDTTRVSMLFPGIDGLFRYEVYFLAKENNLLKISEHISTVL